MTRFLMTLDESADLVLRAIAGAQGGEVFVRKSPACNVLQLADAMRLLFSPRKMKHPVQTIGIRPGEKIHEILVNEYEIQRATEEPKYFIIHPEYRALPNKTPAKLGAEYTSTNAEQLTTLEEVISRLNKMSDSEGYD